MHAARSFRLRPTTAAAAFGGIVGLAVGGAYLGGLAAQASTVRAQAERFQGAGAGGYTQEALAEAAGGLDASALAIAHRHDPYSVAGSAQRDRQAELLTARLDQVQGQGGLRRDGVTKVTAARPFRLDGALDQSRDLECLTQAAYYEARGEGRDGMSAVVQVVLNRVRHSAYPDSICGVVYQGANRKTGCQFSFTCNGAMRGAVNRAAWNRARDVAGKALSGQVFAAVGNATHFHTTAVSPSWRNRLVRVNQVGDHLFYRLGGRSGSRASVPAPSAPRLVQASLDPVEAARSASGAVAYTAVLAREALTPGKADERPTPARASAPPAAPVSSPPTSPKPAAPATTVNAEA
ncbi:cell wall hydrolase [Brevundimonas guildfordensis]|uniref:Cell wall hydrolase n=1 Tax=Brevundimonas guildfordensis TaxID=2762241 RepID=A0ABR8R1Q7_9CAUL|nr:cell wall hydrolase [Brevundimonas guildfordensis]MBD7941717.1 cell wall hydrolase [Brevundimonas guildfordensis]